MTVTQRNELGQTWEKVRAWPQPMRLSLASRILQSIEAEQTRPAKTFADLIGLWGDMPSLSDDDVARILEEERTRKYG